MSPCESFIYEASGGFGPKFSRGLSAKGVASKMEIDLEQCPLCGSDLSHAKYHEIQAKLKGQEQERAAQLTEAKSAVTRRVEAELKKQFEQQRLAAEKKTKEEADQRVKKVLAERDQATKQLSEVQKRVDGIRKQAQLEIEKQKQVIENKAKADVEQQVKKITSERDQTAAKLKAADARVDETRKQMQEEAEKRRQKDLTEQRQILERDKKLALIKQQSEFNRERESLQKKLERKTANELGDDGELDVFEALRDAFQGDKITRIRKGQPGADILQEVLYKGEVCGRIIVDSKNRLEWKYTFVSKLRQDQAEAEAEHAILATTVFPAGKKEMCIESGVIVISRARVVHIVQILRQAMVMMHVRGLSVKERKNKMSQLYQLITSEAYRAKFTELNRLTQDVLELDVKEQAEHGRVWKNRGGLVKRMQNLLRETETDVAAVIEGDGDVGGASPVLDGKQTMLESKAS